MLFACTLAIQFPYSYLRGWAKRGQNPSLPANRPEKSEKCRAGGAHQDGWMIWRVHQMILSESWCTKKMPKAPILPRITIETIGFGSDAGRDPINPAIAQAYGSVKAHATLTPGSSLAHAKKRKKKFQVPPAVPHKQISVIFLHFSMVLTPVCDPWRDTVGDGRRKRPAMWQIVTRSGRDETEKDTHYCAW